MHTFHKTILLVFLFYGFKLRAQDIFPPPATKSTIHANKAANAIKIDGRLDESDWSQEGISNFIQVEPGQGNRSHYPTVVKVLHNRKSLFIGAFLSDTLGKKDLRATDLSRDFSWREHDTFAICIDGFNDQRNSMSFATNPFGAQKDYLSFDATFFDGDWNGLWKVRTTRADSGWVAEFEIPWKSLRYAKSTDSTQTWGINFLRLKRSANEISAWSPYPRSFGFNRMEYAGSLKDLHAPAPPNNLQFNPYTLLLYRKTENDGIASAHTDVKLGGEVKWAINSNTVLDLTANTDFAQADADVQVNNLTRFSVFFPEKRPFFLENASLFGVGLAPIDNFTGGNMVIQPFFSRRIGLDATGSPIPVNAGARLVYRSEKRNAGIIAMNQRANAATATSNMVIGRYSENIGKQNRLSTLFTIRSTADTPDNSRQLDALGSIDGFFRLSTAGSLQAMAMISKNNQGGVNGYSGYAQYLHTTNNFTFWWTQSAVTKDFSPELGFVSRTDVIGTTPGFFLNYRGKWLPYKKLFRSFAPGVTTEFYHQNTTGKLTERNITFYPFWVNFQNGGYVRFSTSPVYQFLTATFMPVGIPISQGSYQYLRNSLSAGTDPSRKISLAATREQGTYYDGTLNTTTVTLNFIPLPHIALKFNVNENEFRGVGLESTDARVRLYTLSGRFALNPRLQLIGLYQHNTQNDRDFYNVRVAWEYKPLSYVYVVLNSNRYTNNTVQKEQTAIFKIAYLKQF